MNNLLIKLENQPEFLSSINKCVREITPILQRYLTNFPNFTDHTIEHSRTVLGYASGLLEKNIERLNIDEIYILVMSCYLHDIGMSPTKNVLKQIKGSQDYKDFLINKMGNLKDYVREFHHKLSFNFIIENWKKLGLPNERYAKAIALVAMGHRKENLIDEELFKPKYIVKSGSDFVCLPFLAGILRLADELDITNDRITDLLFDKYLPQNIISKKEWVKHKSTYYVSFDENKIIIIAQCSNRQLYESLLKRYNKVEETLTYVRKIIRHLPFKDRDLKIEFTEVKPDIETKGFIPKNIRFSFDLPNIFNTLIGKRIYSNKFVAIREALQNSIDTCKYKKILDPTFSPRILVFLEGNKLILEDNGLGMDEFIIENFFAKLGSSFYAQKRITEKFESISEFGIGIFSYFLLCDYFDVETKMEHKSSLRFRVTNNASSNFFFFDDTKRTFPGTTVTFFLRQSLSFEDLTKHVRHYLMFAEIPIILVSGSRKITIESQKFKISEKEELKKRLNIINQERIKDLKILTKYIETDEYIGVCGLILTKDKSTKLVPQSLYKIIENEWNEISICHKGIFVNNIHGERLLKNFFGKINIKKKSELSLNRTSLIDSYYLENILSCFVARIMEDLFTSWRSLTREKKAKFTSLFIDNYIRTNRIPEQIRRIVFTKFWISCYVNFKKGHFPLRVFLDKYKKFMLFQIKNYNYKREEDIFENIKRTYQKFGLPMLLVYDDVDDEFYLNLFRSLEKEISIVSNAEKSFYVINNKQKVLKKKWFVRYPEFEFIAMCNKWISTYSGIDLKFPFNTKHPLAQFMIKKEEEITSDPKLYNLFVQLFKALYNFIFDFHVGGIKKPSKRLKNLNKIIRVINKLMNTKLKILKSDFPIWMQKKI